MSEGKRPGGLTALAVLNFVWTGLGAFIMLGLGWWLAVINVPELQASLPKSDEMDAALNAMRALGTSGLIVLIAGEGLLTLLLLVSGIGYMKQRAFLGRTLGTVYALLSIASTIAKTQLIESKEAGGGFELLTILVIVYPLLTLVLLNTTFKEDFAR